MVPPCRQIGERVEPERARPVPFCRHGFLPPPAISPRVLVEAVPARRFASCIRTASCSNDLWPLRPNTAPDNSKSPVRSRLAENNGTLTASTVTFPAIGTAFCPSSIGFCLLPHPPPP